MCILQLTLFKKIIKARTCNLAAWVTVVLHIPHITYLLKEQFILVLEVFHVMQYRRLGIAKLIQHMKVNENSVCSYQHFPLLGK